MRLCFVGPAGSIHTQRWVSAFVRFGHEVHLVTLPDDPAVTLPGVVCHALPAGKPKLRFAVWTLALRRILTSVRPDLLHAHYLTRYGWLAAASLFRPSVLTAWGSDVYIDLPRSRLTRQVARWALGRADLVTVDAADLRERTIAAGARPGRTELVQWGVDTNVFRPDVDTSALRSRLDLTNRPVILSTRAVTPLYNQHVIVEALPLILAQVPGVRLIVKYGAFDAAYLGRVKEDVQRLGLGEAVRFVEQTPYNELAAYYALGDIFVSIASSDSTPVSLLEAMACGTAPVVSELPALAEWVQDGVNGFLVPPQDPKVLSERVVRLLTDAGLRDRFAEANVQSVRERANHEGEMRRMEALYKRLCRR